METHDIDTNAQEITFNYAPNDTASVRAACTPAASEWQFTCIHGNSKLFVELHPDGRGRITSQP